MKNEGSSQCVEIYWKRLLVTGIVTMVLGLSAIMLPFLAILTLQVIIAFILIIAAMTHFFHASQSSQPQGFILRLLVAGIYAFFGVLLLVYPLKGALTLTVLLAFLFMIGGTVKIAHSLVIRPLASWSWLMFSGVLSVLLGLLIWLKLPEASNWVIGLVVGIELLFSGWAMTLYAIAIKNNSQTLEQQ